MEPVPQGWAGVDVGKGHHWVCLIDEDGTTLWSSKVVNDETAILEAISEIRSRAAEVTWAVDVTGTMSGLLLALLAAHDETVKYVPRPDRQHDGRRLPRGQDRRTRRLCHR